MKKSKQILLLIFYFVLTGATAQKVSSDLSEKIKAFDAYVEASKNSWTVPGLAVVVVKDNEVLFNKGYGVRELGTKHMVDTQTLFACASTTKAMTATCMGILVDEGRVNWNDPVIKHLPDFRVFDPFVTRELKIRDLFIHNSGVGNADFLWTAMDVSQEEVLRKLALVEPSYSFRGGYTYQNIFYLTAGKVIEKVSGKSWDQFIAEKIFTPLEMTRSVPLLSQVKDPNQTKPHYLIDGSIRVIQHSSADVIGPAGSVWSCTNDMAKWMMCMLDSSKYSGGRLLKSATWMEMFKPQTIIPINQFYPTSQLTKPNWTTYGLGWFQHDYMGKKVNFHTGSLAGAVAIHGQLPEANLGIYVFGNYGAEFRHALMYKAFDLFALGGTRDWNTEFLEMYKNLDESSKKRTVEFESKRIVGTQPSLKLDQYVGKFSNPLYGKVTISKVENELAISLNEIVTARVTHWHYDTFRGKYNKEWSGKLNVAFHLSATGAIEEVDVGTMTFKKEN